MRKFVSVKISHYAVTTGTDVELDKYGTMHLRGVGIWGATWARAPLSLQKVVVNKLPSLKTSLSVELNNTQLRHTC